MSFGSEEFARAITMRQKMKNGSKKSGVKKLKGGSKKSGVVMGIKKLKGGSKKSGLSARRNSMRMKKNSKKKSVKKRSR